MVTRGRVAGARHVLREPGPVVMSDWTKNWRRKHLSISNYQLNALPAAARHVGRGEHGRQRALQRCAVSSLHTGKELRLPARGNGLASFARAYQLKAFQEGRLPPYALDRP